MAAPPVRFTVWSDFLCPWCYVAAVRLDALHQEVGDVLTIEWRSFLLRPRAEDRTREAFTRYTEHWARPAAAEPLASFRTWSGEHPPPSHSMPSAVAGKAVAHRFGAEAFARFHLASMHAYFAENLTISDRDVILDVARGVAIDPVELGTTIDNEGIALEAEVVADHKAALAQGLAAVPTVVIDDEYILQGALGLEQYRKVVGRLAG